MGSFSWLKADTLTKVANIVQGEPFKMLIPAKFGGGFIADYYRDYGRIYDMPKDERRAERAKIKQSGLDFDYSEFDYNSNIKKYDMYELLAFWNWNHKYGDYIVLDYLIGPLADTMRSIYLAKKEIKNIIPLKQEDIYTKTNRNIGINIGCYNSQIDDLDYPLKLVSYSYQGSYEQCKGRSYGDPEQGFSPLYRDNDRNGWSIKYGCYPPKEEYNTDIPDLDAENLDVIEIPDSIKVSEKNSSEKSKKKDFEKESKKKEKELDNMSTQKQEQEYNFLVTINVTFTSTDSQKSSVKVEFTTKTNSNTLTDNKQLNELIIAYKNLGYNMTSLNVQVQAVERFDF